MTPSLIIAHNRQALLRLVAMVFAASGLLEKTGVSRYVRGTILYYLRPMESAARRLIFVSAQGLVVKLRAARGKPITPIPRNGNNDRISAFRLIDPRTSLSSMMRNPRPAKGPVPNIWFFDGPGPTGQPVTETPPPGPDAPIESGGLLRRLQALEAALNDLPKQARRMARTLARRKLAPPGPRRVPPIRGGRPPGHRARGKYEIDEILRACHQLALQTLASPDTS